MLRNRSIALKLIIVFTLSSALIFTTIIGYNYYRSRMILKREAEVDARTLGLSLVRLMETHLVAVAGATESLARSLEAAEYSDEELLALIRGTVEGNPDIFGTCIAYEPYARKPARRVYDPYFYRNNGTIVYLATEPSDDYVHLDWYQIARETEKPDWTEPYWDAYVDTLMATYSVPFYRGKGRARHLAGVVGSDVRLSSLTKLVSSVKVLETGYAAIISRNGTILAHPDPEMILNENIFSIAERDRSAELRSLGKKMVRGESGFVRYASMQEGQNWMYHAPIGSTGWTLAVTFPEAELFADLNTLSATMAGVGLAGMLLLTLAIITIARSITKPLRNLAAATNALATGNFELELPAVRSHDEVGTLTHDFQAMKVSLLEYIRNLTETTAAKERIQSELRMATDIQTSLLPRIFPPFPDRPEFDIFASMDPAKEVGGDFYDFFFIDNDRLCFLIADVSDKGVPAALYMMVAKTLLKTEAQRLGEPSEILARVNDILAADNINCMFVTVFCAILDAGSGEVHFANAGHNPPLVTKGGQDFNYLPIKAGFVLGAMPAYTYETERIAMQPGDIFFLYTDGVTEAMNPDAEQFGQQQLQDTLESTPHKHPADLIHAVRARVERHAKGAPQSDDITMLAVKFKGRA